MKVPILLPKVFNHPFTYETSLKLKLGDYVEVPFGNSKTVGVVWDEFENNQFKKFKIKKVIKKLNLPNLSKKMVNFINWFSEYNIIPKGMALKLSLSNNGILELNPLIISHAEANGLRLFKTPYVQLIAISLTN